MGKQYEFGLVISGDSSGAVSSFRAARDEAKKLTGELDKSAKKEAENAAVARELKKGHFEAAEAIQKLTQRFELQAKAAGKLSAAQARLRGDADGLSGSLGRQHTILRSGVGAWGAWLAVAGGASVLIADQAAQLVRLTADYQDFSTRLKNMSGSSAEYADNEAYLIDLADRHHKSILTLGDSYTRLMALEQSDLLTKQQSRAILEGLSDTASALGASNVQLEQSMYGLAQGLSAGTLRAEELNQVTEPLPGLMQKLDEASGNTAGGFRRMVNEGQVTSEMFRDTLIVALQGYNGAAASTADNLRAKWADLENARLLMAASLEQPISDALVPVVETTTAVIKDFSENSTQYLAAVGAVGAAVFSRLVVSMTASAAATVQRALAVGQMAAQDLKAAQAAAGRAGAEVTAARAVEASDRKAAAAAINLAESEVAAAKAALAHARAQHQAANESYESYKKMTKASAAVVAAERQQAQLIRQSNSKIAESQALVAEAANKHKKAVEGVYQAQDEYRKKSNLARWASGGLKTAWENLSPLIGGLSGGLLIGGAALVTYALNMDEAKVRAQKIVGPIDTVALAVRDLYDALSGDNAAQLLAAKIDGFAKNSAQALVTMIDDAKERVAELEDIQPGDGVFDVFQNGKYDAAQRELAALKEELKALEGALKRVDPAGVAAGNALAGVGDQGAKAAKQTAEQAGSVKKLLADLEKKRIALGQDEAAQVRATLALANATPEQIEAAEAELLALNIKKERLAKLKAEETAAKQAQKAYEQQNAQYDEQLILLKKGEEALIKYRLEQQGLTEEQIENTLEKYRAVKATEAQIESDKKAADAAKELAEEAEKQRQELANWYSDLEKKLNPVAAAQEEYNKKLAYLNETLEKSSPAYKQAKKYLDDWFDGIKQSPFDKLVKELAEERSQLEKTARQRFIDTQLRKLGSDATREQIALIEQESGALYDLQNRSETTAELMKKSFESALERIDASFADAWLNIDNGFDDLVDGITGSFKKMLAEMAHQAITQPIMLNIQQSVSGAGSASGGGFNPASMLNSGTTGVSNWLSGTSISDGISGLFGTATGGAAGSAQLAGNAAALKSGAWSGQTMGGVSNLGMGVAGIAGGIGANLLYGGKGESGTGGSLGAMAGMYALGPWGALAGTILGGGFGSLFGGESEPEFDFRTRDLAGGRKFEDEESGVIARSAFGDLGFDAENTHKLKSSFDGFENAQKFLNTMALMDNAIAGLAQSDDELENMIKNVRQMDVEAGSPAGILDQISDRYLAALSQTTSRITGGITIGAETLSRHEFSREDFELVEFEKMVVSIENALLEEFLKLDTDKAIPAITSVIQMERIGDAIGGAVTDDLYRALNDGVAEGVDLSELTADLFGAMTVLPALGQLNGSFDMTASGALNAANEMVKLAGGVGNLQTLQSQYYELFYSEEEKKADRQAALQEQVNAAFGKWNAEVPTSIEGFRELKEGLDLMTEEGREANLALLQISPAFAELFELMGEGEESIEEAAAALSDFTDIANSVDLSVRPISSVQQALDSLNLTFMSVSDAVELIDAQSPEELQIAADALGLSSSDAAQAVSVLTGANKELIKSYASVQQRIDDVLNPKTDDQKVSGALSALGYAGMSVESALASIGNMTGKEFEALRDTFSALGDDVNQYIDVLLDAASAEDVAVAAKESGIDVTNRMTSAVDKSNDAQEERNRLLEQEAENLKGLQSGYARIGETFEGVIDAAVGSLVDNVKTNFTDAGGVEGLLGGDAGKNLADLSSVRNWIGDLEGLSADIAHIDSGGYAAQLQKELDDVQDAKYAAMPAANKAVYTLSGVDDPADYEYSGSDASVGLWIDRAQAWMNKNATDLLPTGSELLGSIYDSAIGQIKDSIGSIDSLREQYAYEYSDIVSESGSSLDGLKVREHDLVNSIESIEDSFGGMVQLLDENGNIIDEIAANIIGSDEQIAELAKTFRSEFEAGFSEAMNIDLADVGATFDSVAEKYANAAYSQEELLDIQREAHAARVDEFADLGISSDLTMAQFREMFEAIKGTVDGETLARWWAAADAMSDLTGTLDQIADINPVDSAVEPENADVKALDKYLQTVSDYVKDQSKAIKDNYRDQIKNLEKQQDVARQLRDYVEQIRISELSPSGPAEKLAAAQESFAQLLVKAEAGDLDAAGQLTSAANTYLQHADGYYGRSDAYTTVFEDVTGAMDRLGVDLLEVSDEEAIKRLNEQMNSKLQALSRYAQQEVDWAVAQARELSGIEDALSQWPDKFSAIIDGLAGDIGSAVAGAIPAPVRPASSGGSAAVSGSGGSSASGGASGASMPAVFEAYKNKQHFEETDLFAAMAEVGISTGAELNDYINGSHAKGLERVPFDGYRAELHEGETVLTRPTADVIRSLPRILAGNQSGPSVQVISFDEMLEEMRQLRNEVASLRAEQGQANQTAQRQRDDQHRATESVARTNRKVVEVV